MQAKYDTIWKAIAERQWVVFDLWPDVANGGQTYLCEGDEPWLPDKSRAIRFASVELAQAAIEACDPAEWLRDRLVVLPA
jgi:hypothetical protein